MSESTPEAQAEAFRAMRDALQDVVQGMQGDDPNSSYMGRQAASIWADVNRMLQHPATADTPEGALVLAVRGRAEGAEVDVERVLAELPGERRKAWVAAPLALGCLPLNLACEHASPEVVKALLNAGAPIHALDAHSGHAPLHAAAEACRPEVVELLLRRGANPLQLDSTGRTPRQACLYKAAGGPLASILPSLPRPPMQHDQAALQRCVQLLKAAEAAAGPELQHARKAAAACAHCGGKDGLKRCNGCTLACYCNEQCAKLAWRGHKQRCQVAQEMRRRLALLADVTKPPNERWDAMNFVIGTPDTIRLACKLQALKLLEPAVPEDKPVGMGPAPMYPQYIPSLVAITGVMARVAAKERRWDAPVPPLVQQFCALGLPERLLERLFREDVPAENLQYPITVLTLLSRCRCGQALPRQLVQCGSALRVARLLCALPWGVPDGPDRDMLNYATGIIGGLLEAERRATAQRQEEEQEEEEQQQGQQGQQQAAALTPLETHLLSARAFMDSCAQGLMLSADNLAKDLMVFLCSLFGSPAMLARLLERPDGFQGIHGELFTTIIAPADTEVQDVTPVYISWIALLVEQQPAFFAQLPSMLAGGLPVPPVLAAPLWASCARLAQRLTSYLTSGQLPSTCDHAFVHVERVQSKAAAVLLALLRDLRGELHAACRAAATAQQLRAAAAASEQRGGADGHEAARLLRQAAALV